MLQYFVNSVNAFLNRMYQKIICEKNSANFFPKLFFLKIFFLRKNCRKVKKLKSWQKTSTYCLIV